MSELISLRPAFSIYFIIAIISCNVKGLVQQIILRLNYVMSWVGGYQTSLFAVLVNGCVSVTPFWY
jgi:hypothetical protein